MSEKIALIIGLGVSHCLAGMPVIDPSNLVQNTITALEQVASYSRQVSDGVRQIQEFDKHATEFTNETLGLGSMLGNINSISKDISDIYEAVDDVESLKDPENLFKDKYEDYISNYKIYDKCNGLKDNALNVCLRRKINYAAGIKQHSKYGNVISDLQEELDEQISKLNTAISQKDRENATLSIIATQAQLEKVRSLNELDNIEYRNNQRIAEEQAEELFAQSINTTYSVADRYKNIGKE